MPAAVYNVLGPRAVILDHRMLHKQYIHNNTVGIWVASERRELVTSRKLW